MVRLIWYDDHQWGFHVRFISLKSACRKSRWQDLTEASRERESRCKTPKETQGHDKKRVSNREDQNALDVVTMQLRSKSSVIKKQQQDIFMLS